MKKIVLSGLCAAMLAGSSHQADAMDASNNQWKMAAIASTVVAGSCTLMWGTYEFGIYLKGKIIADWAEYSHPEVFDILNDEDFSQQQMTERVLAAFGTCKYKCHEAVDALENLVKRLQKASRHFRESEKWYLFSRWARGQRKVIDHIKANANYAAATMRSDDIYQQEKEEIERLEDRAHQQKVECIEAEKPTNELGVKISEDE